MIYDRTIEQLEVPYVSEVSPRLRLQEVNRHYTDTPIDDPQSVYGFLRNYMRDFSQEVLIIVNLNSHRHIINVCQASIGSSERTPCLGRDVMKTAILSNASSFIVAHNHPSARPGDTISLSPEDLRCTQKLVTLGMLTDIPLLDHLVIGSNGKSYSLLIDGHGLLTEMRQKAKEVLSHEW